MSEIKLTKNELRAQQMRLNQLEKYLPTLQLKKAMLQLEVHDARMEIEQQQRKFDAHYQVVEQYSALLSEKIGIDPTLVTQIAEVKKTYENIAGVEIPIFDCVEFIDKRYSLFESPPWVDGAISGLRKLVSMKENINVAIERKNALERELREVSIRVNLFEKILIPRAIGNIKKIKVFLGDQELAAVSQAKVAKGKIIEKKMKKAQTEEFYAN